MLIPRYSIRWLLGLTTLCAAVSLVLSSAVRGEAWAIGISAGLASLFVVALLHMGAFLLAWMFSRMGSNAAGNRAAGDSPFAPAIPPTRGLSDDTPQAISG